MPVIQAAWEAEAGGPQIHGKTQYQKQANKSINTQKF
jgi:hypothetical protein